MVSAAPQTSVTLGYYKIQLNHPWCYTKMRLEARESLAGLFGH